LRPLRHQAQVLAGRAALALLFLAAAPRHFSAEGIQHAAELGVPFAPLLVPASGVMAVAGGLSVLLGYRARQGAWVLIAFLVPVTAMMHQFWTVADPAWRHVQLAMFAKNVALVGALLHVAWFGAGPLSADAVRARSPAGGAAGSGAPA